jgi:cytochrome c-type biogenesis protein
MAELAQKPATTTSAAAINTKSQPIDSVPRHIVFLHSLFFVLGFTLVFTLTGAAVGLFGSALNQNALMQFGAIVLTIFALATLGVFRWLVQQVNTHLHPNENPAAAALVSVLDLPNKLLYSERRVTGVNDVKRNWGYLSSTAMGIAFAAGWTPCIGPILGSILFLGMSSQTVWQSVALLLVYSAGLGIPFLLTGAAFGSMSRWLRKLNRHAGIVSLISGFFMLYVAFLLWSGQLGSLTTQYPALNNLFLQLNDVVLVGEKWLGSVTGTGGNPVGASVLVGGLLAFSAGLLSFLSPCVLPLVPAYIGYLSGAVVGARPQG